MTETTSRHDAWQAGDAYDAYMGRWSRPMAEFFLDWLDPPAGLDWLEVGCGTGALTAGIVHRCDPASVVALDPSAGFLARAGDVLADARVDLRLGDASTLSAMPEASRDMVVSGLVLNFLPDPIVALREMARIARPGGTVAFYVWDYPGGGMEFVRAFWNVATALDPAANDLTEAARFPFCTEEGLGRLLRQAGIVHWQSKALASPTLFTDFDDYWRPFTLGAGPAPGYCMSLNPAAQAQLRDLLSRNLPRQADGTIALSSRAWGFRTVLA